ncbi:hypothetical protein [Aquitalea sp.]|jgi:hypothetical protein|uniref:hypothetical protein n=1 Tax=Aquitalea sp. TaxID=1872623 RepID=UPI00258614BF|nr:hypothetical protein [Aquitalea sp.]
MKLPTLLIGMILGAGTVFIYYLVARPIFWHKNIKLIKHIEQNDSRIVFETSELKKEKFRLKKNESCFLIDDGEFSFFKADPKDYTILKALIICPDHGAGWID